MKPETIKHIEANQELFRFWIERNEKLQYSNDIFKPFIKDFEDANKGVNLKSCPECVIDMLRWAIKEIKNVPKAK